MTMLSALQKLPTINSPKIRPKKNGTAFRCDCSPPYLRIIHFAKELITRQNQMKSIPKLMEIA